MKKICAISTIDITLSSFVVDAMRELKKEGYDITLLTSMSKEFLKKNESEFHCINLQMSRGTNPWDMIKSIFRLYIIFRKQRFDYIQYATPNASFYASIASFLVGCPRRVYCQWGIRYIGFDGGRRSLFKRIEKITCKLSTHIRAASMKNLQFAVAEGHYKIEKAAIIGAGGTIGVDLSVFDKSKKQMYKDLVTMEYLSLRDKFVFGFVGRLDKDKGINELFFSFLELSKCCKNISLLIIGPEDKVDGIDMTLYNQIKQTDGVVFTDFTKEVAKYISVLDVLVHPSYREGFSMVIQQAMAMEVAVITTNIPGPSEVIEENISGLLVPVKNSTHLTEAMRKLYLDNNTRISMSKKGYERADLLFNRKKMLQLTLADRKAIIEDV